MPPCQETALHGASAQEGDAARPAVAAVQKESGLAGEPFLPACSLVCSFVQNSMFGFCSETQVRKRFCKMALSGDSIGWCSCAGGWCSAAHASGGHNRAEHKSDDGITEQHTPRTRRHIAARTCSDSSAHPEHNTEPRTRTPTTTACAAAQPQQRIAALVFHHATGTSC